MSATQKHSLIYGQVIREFNRLHQLAIVAGEVAIPTPTSSMISSYASYKRLKQRGGDAVGAISLQHVLDFAESISLTPATREDEPCCIQCVVDCERNDPFFAIVLTTKRLLGELDSSKPIETDETFKVMHEGYALTLIGQSDMNRVWHVR